MKKYYESVEINITFFDNDNVVAASAGGDFTPSYEQGDDETEILF